jgi:hypothetical protein
MVPVESMVAGDRVKRVLGTGAMGVVSPVTALCVIGPPTFRHAGLVHRAPHTAARAPKPQANTGFAETIGQSAITTRGGGPDSSDAKRRGLPVKPHIRLGSYSTG